MMSRKAALLALLFCFAVSPARGDTYAVLKNGVWRADLSHTTPTWELVVAFLPEDTLLIAIVDGPPDDDDGDATRIDRIATLSRATLGEVEANAVSLLVRTIRDTGTTDATRGMEMALNALVRFSRPEEGRKFKAWKLGLDKIITKYNQAAMSDVLAGLKKAWGVSETAGLEERLAEAASDAEAIDLDRLKRLLELVMFLMKLFGFI